MEYVIEIENLCKDYEIGFWKKKKVRALDGISLKVSKGQIFGFLGGNGAGKTTTIKILMTLLYPSAGSAKILGRDISDVKMHQRIGYCPENPYFYDYLTARELMNYFGQLFGLDANSRKVRTETLLTKVGLDEKDWDKQLRKFSKGMQQRVGLAQSLINDPEVIFMDEPMSGLDPIGRREVRELIAELREQGKTVFMSTHILSDIEALCDEVAILRKGRLAATGNLSDLLSNSGEEQHYEVIAKTSDPQGMSKVFEQMGGISVASKAQGVNIMVESANDIDVVLKNLRDSGGTLVSVLPVKQSLEELFVEKTND